MTQEDTKIPRGRWNRIALLLFLIYTAAFLDRGNISIAAPQMTKDLGITAVSMGVLLSIFFWGYVITQIPGGWVAQRFSPKWVIIIAMFIWGIFSALTGYMRSYGGVETARFLMGLAEGVVWPSFIVVVFRWFPGKERAQALNLLLISLPLGSLIAYPLGGWMIATWNWHVMFYLQAIPPIILSIAGIFLLFDDPVKDPYLSSTERDYILAYRTKEPTKTEQRTSLVESFKDIKLWGLGLAYLCWISGFYAFGLWLPTVVNGLTRAGIGAVGLISTIPPIIGIIAMFLNARASDKAEARAKYVIWPLVVGGIGLVISRFVTQPVLELFLLSVGAIGVYASFGPWWAWCAEHVAPENVGATNGFVNFAGNFGGIVGPIFVAVVVGAANIGTGFWVLGVGMFLSAILAWIINKSKTNHATVTGLAS